MDFAPIFEAIESGKPLKQALAELNIPLSRFYRALDKDCLAAEIYSRARARGFDTLAESLLTVHEDVLDPHRARLRSDNVKWLLARWAAKKYGDRLDINVTERVDPDAAITAARARVLAMREQAPAYITQVIDSQAELVPEPRDETSVGSIFD